MRSPPQRQAKNPRVAIICFSNASSAVNPGVHTVEHLHTADFKQKVDSAQTFLTKGQGMQQGS